ncbi:MAG: hypothetical protein CMO47_00690 [Verrucomicrobiales bacterium]|nr:hypothetical protein [Verrucomicrobiales bacterium]
MELDSEDESCVVQLPRESIEFSHLQRRLEVDLVAHLVAGLVGGSSVWMVVWIQVWLHFWMQAWMDVWMFWIQTSGFLLGAPQWELLWKDVFVSGVAHWSYLWPHRQILLP